MLDGKKLVAKVKEETRFVKSEHSTLQNWLKVLQSEDKTLKTEIVQWKEKATSEKLELESCIRSLQGELEGWKQRAKEEEGIWLGSKTLPTSTNPKKNRKKNNRTRGAWKKGKGGQTKKRRATELTNSKQRARILPPTR